MKYDGGQIRSEIRSEITQLDEAAIGSKKAAESSWSWEAHATCSNQITEGTGPRKIH